MSSTNSSSPTIHLPTLLLCVLAAMVIWLMKALNKDDYTLTVQYPIQFLYDRNAFVPVTPLPKTITVSISGNGWNLLRKSFLPFRSESVKYKIPDPLRTRVLNTATLSEALTDHAKDVRVNFVAGDTLTLQFDRLSRREIPVVLDSTSIDLADRTVISSLITVSPRTIRFEGPGRLLRVVPDTIRLRLPHRRISANYDEEVRIDYPRHPLIQTATERVMVSFEVAELLSPLPASTSAPPKKK